MKRAGLIGIGTITKDYALGLEKTKKFSLVSICDIKDNPIGKDLFPKKTFYKDVNKMLKGEHLDMVIISTPPATHYDLIKKCFSYGVDAIVEKPCVLDISQFSELAKIAKTNNLKFIVSYHWQNGEEVRKFNRFFDKNKIEKISIHVDDPYSKDGANINDEKIPLEGCFIDSGVNAISLIKMWLPFKTFEIKNTEIIYAKNVKLPIYSHVFLDIDGVPVDIEIDWRNNKNFKCTKVVYEGRDVVINHSEQTIFDGTKIIRCSDMIRLTRHYYNFFTSLKDKSNYINSFKIHNLLLKVRDHYEVY